MIAIGANLPSAMNTTPLGACQAAAAAIGADENMTLIARSAWYETAPVPASDQPWYVNGVVALHTTLAPDRLMAVLHDIEARFGRTRRTRNEARAMDLDMLAYGRMVAAPPSWPVLPHPRLCQRLFVLLPLRDVAPRWCHPVDGRSIDQLIEGLAPEQGIRRLDGDPDDPVKA